MCGIAGIVRAKPIEEPLLRVLLETLQHRGPDDRGWFLNPDKTVALVHTRLSILDLSPAGHQPMTNESCPKCHRGDSSLWLTYNGEIYNFQELREEMVSKGHLFHSRTDSEVLLHLYQEEGPLLVHRLVGMFAFAVYDRRGGRLFLARDRLGIKPLYYCDYGGAFLFASEIKALLSTGLIPKEPDWQAVWDYFTFHFIPHPQTAFKGIRQIPPAHTLVLDLKTRRFSLNRYWTPWTPSEAIPQGASYPQLRDRVRDLLLEAVRSELVSDVPLGLFFSGGIDSTLLAALMSRLHPDKIKTFTVVFRDPGLGFQGDLPYARRASQLLQTEHHELFVDLEGPEALLDTVRLVDQPLGNPTLYLQHLIAKATRRHVTVALSGVGGDELFGGYPKYRLIPWAPLLGFLPQFWGRWGTGLLGLIREDTWVPALRKAKRLLKGVGVSLPLQYLHWSYYASEEEKRRLLNNKIPGTASLEPSDRIVKEAMALAPRKANRYEKIFMAELETFLADNLLEYTDRATMAVALETRVPFLDHRLVELAAQIPFHDKIHQGSSKFILMDAFRDLLPEPIARAPKRGFSPPLKKWMNQLLDSTFDSLFTRRRVEEEGLFSWEAIQELRRTYQEGRRDSSQELLALLLFEAWYQTLGRS